jgi:hypothetical protein
MHTNFMRLIAVGAFACLGLCTAKVEAAKLNTGDFVAACGGDPSVTDDPGFEEGKVTPKAYCECVAGELEKSTLSQKDVDMLTKMHNEDISDSDAASYPTLEDLLNANEGYEDSCRKTLGLPADAGDEGVPEEDAVPDDEEEAPPADENKSPPQ